MFMFLIKLLYNYEVTMSPFFIFKLPIVESYKAILGTYSAAGVKL